MHVTAQAYVCIFLCDTHACVSLDAGVCLFMQLTEHLLYAGAVLEPGIKLFWGE